MWQYPSGDVELLLILLPLHPVTITLCCRDITCKDKIYCSRLNKFWHTEGWISVGTMVWLQFEHAGRLWQAKASLHWFCKFRSTGCIWISVPRSCYLCSASNTCIPLQSHNGKAWSINFVATTGAWRRLGFILCQYVSIFCLCILLNKKLTWLYSFVNRDMFMWFLGSGMGHKVTWRQRLRSRCAGGHRS